MLPLTFLSLLSMCVKPAKSSPGRLWVKPHGWMIETWSHEVCCWSQTSNPAPVMLSVYKLEGYIPLTAMSGGTAQPFCKWSHRVPIRIVEKNMGNDRLGWAGCWWVAGMGQGQLVVAQLPPSCSLRCSFNVLWPLSPRETGERVGKPKVRKTHGSRWRRFNKWMGKKKIPADAKAITHHLPPADRCPAILQAAAKHKKSLFYWGAWCIWCEISLGSLDQLSPPSLLRTPRLLMGQQS